MFRLTIALPILAATAASAQTVNATYATGLLNALQSANLTSFASAAQSMATSAAGQAVLSRLSQGKNTLLVPSNSAFRNANQAILSNTTLVSAVLEYHVLSGAFNLGDFGQGNNHTIARTFLNDPNFVHLEGNVSQAIVLAYDNSTLRVRNQPAPVAVEGTSNYDNLIIHTVDSVLTIPGDINAVLSSYSLDAFKNALGNTTLYPSLTAARGVTIFAPVDTAFTNISSTLSGLSPTALQTVLSNHIINGTTIYTSLLNHGSYTSAGGQPFSMTSNSSGLFVTSGAATARVLLSDIVTQNGVLHVIDNVLANQQSNPGAAQSAYNSATAAAATAAQATAAIGQTAATSSSTGGTSGNSAVSRVAGRSVEAMTILGGVLAGAALLI